MDLILKGCKDMFVKICLSIGYYKITFIVKCGHIFQDMTVVQTIQYKPALYINPVYVLRKYTVRESLYFRAVALTPINEHCQVTDLRSMTLISIFQDFRIVRLTNFRLQPRKTNIHLGIDFLEATFVLDPLKKFSC